MKLENLVGIKFVLNIVHSYEIKNPKKYLKKKKKKIKFLALWSTAGVGKNS
jgi:hypothetical protein